MRPVSHADRSISKTTLPVVLVAAAGCNVRASGRSTVTSTVGKRTITVKADGAAGIKSEGDARIASFTGHQVRIEGERVLVDGAERAKLDAAAARIEISWTDGALTVTADGVEIFKSRFEK